MFLIYVKDLIVPENLALSCQKAVAIAPDPRLQIRPHGRDIRPAVL